jgi:hypothetical protein
MKNSVIYAFLHTITPEIWLFHARWDSQKNLLNVILPKEKYYPFIKHFPKSIRMKFKRYPFITIKIRPTGKYTGGWIWLGHYIPIVPDMNYRDIYLSVFHGNKFPLPENIPDESLNAWKHFFLQIPHEVRWKACVLASRQWRLWQLINKFPKEGGQLLETNPVLAYMVSNFHHFTNRKTSYSWKTIGNLLKQKQTQILKKMGFPASSSFIKILRKLDYFDLYADHEIFLKLREYFSDCTIRKIMLHLQTIIPPHLEMLQYEKKNPELLHIDLFREISFMGSEDVLYLVKEITRILEMLESGPGKRKIISTEALQRYHEKLILRLNTSKKEGEQNVMGIRFPEPPLQGKIDQEKIRIEPVINSRQLFLEGREMKHCVYSYLKVILFKKNIYIYKITQPERATIAVQQDQTTGKWKVKEIRGKQNAKVAPDIIRLVQEWVEEENLKNVYKQYDI